MEIVKGDLLEAKEEIILQQCNCKTYHAKGLSEAIFDRFPYANTYKKGIQRIPGTIAVMKKEGNKTIINCYGQDYQGKPNKDESKEKRLEWFKSCLAQVKKYQYRLMEERVKELEEKMKNIDIECVGKIEITIKVGAIAVPYKIGCGLAGGDWEDYQKALQESGLNIVIYKNE